MSKFTLILDSTQISNHMACPAMWFLGDRRRLLRNDIAAQMERRDSSALDMGTYFHKLCEVYYKNYRFKLNQEQAVDMAMVLDMDHEVCECKHHLETHQLGLGSCVAPECQCKGFKAKPFPLNADKRRAVRDRFFEYISTYSAKGDFDVTSPDHVEVGFSELLYEDSERIFILEGRMDIAEASYNGTKCVVDHKLQLRRKDLYLKRIQFRNYAMVSRQPFLIVNYCRMAKEASNETFKRAIASFTALEHKYWKEKLIYIYTQIANHLMTAGGILPTQNWGNCETGNGYSECQFTPLCEETYLGERMMNNRIDQLYSIREEWKPW